jgi:hypothetical protein
MSGSAIAFPQRRFGGGGGGGWGKVLSNQPHFGAI